MRDPILMSVIVIAIGVAAAMLYGWWWTQRVPRDVDAITEAIFGIGQFKGVRQESVIKAIKEYGDVNGFSPRHQCSFLYAAAAFRRRDVVSWLLDNSVDPNPQGPSPLLACIDVDDQKNARRLLKQGARWDAEVEPGTTVLEAARRDRPELVEQLLQEFPQ